MTATTVQSPRDLSRRPRARWITALAGTVAVQELLYALAGDRHGWLRKNYRGRSVSLVGGAGAALAGIGAAASADRELRTAALLATVTSAATGGLDDSASGTHAAKGLRGHLAALRGGDVTTGLVKLAGISAAAALAGLSLARNRGAAGRHLVADALTSAGVIAGSANLINLFDLRPGRALKVGGILAAVLAADRSNPGGARLALTTSAITAALAPRDLREHTMLGDTGANTLGALIGTALATHPDPRVRLGALAGITGLILAAERVSFSTVIDNSPILSRLDGLGRGID